MAERRELRIAPVMTGGTSLAVWMGGVTRELFAMARAGDDGPSVYGQLLELTDTTPVVDVITGTSAGGLNGSLLAAGLAFGVSTAQFDSIRETWMRAADLERLLRDPKELDPPSLLRGDYFVEQITTVLERWRPPAPLASTVEVDLVTTYTAVTPQPVHTRDDFGARLNEVVHAGTLRFRSQDFRDARIVEKLALASRTSASIPGVFEPVFLGVDATTGADFSNHFATPAVATGRWAVDGGVVVNLPLGEALDRIFERGATSEVRRVIMYVCPTPRGDEDPPPDVAAVIPTIAQSVATIATAPRAEGIAGDVERIAANNDQVRRQQGLRQSLGSLTSVLGRQLDDPDSAVATELMAQYLRLRVDQSIDQMLARLRQAMGSIPGEAEVREHLHRARGEVLPRSVDEFAGGGRSWGWGIAPVEQAVSFGLSLVGRAVELAAWLPDSEPGRAAAEELRDAKAELHGVRAVVEAVRVVDQEYWRAWAALADDRSHPTSAEIAALGTTLYEEWPYADPPAAPAPQPPLPDPDPQRVAVFGRLLGAHADVADIIVRIAPTIDVVVRTLEPAPDELDDTATRTLLPRTVEDMRVAVGGELDQVYLAGGSSVPAVQRQLLVAHVVQTLFLGNVRDREQPAELLQVSWNARNELVQRSPNEKLVGTELARLGAFLKPAWRANDWLWGRMDGAARLVPLLLDPNRLLQLGIGADDVLRTLDVEANDDLRDELAFLDARDEAPIVPDRLEHLSAVLIRRVQLAIAKQELPLIGEAIDELGTDAIQQDNGTFRRTLAEAGPLTDDNVVAVLDTLRVGEETAAKEFGSNLTVRLATRGVGVAVNALTSPSAGIPVVPGLLRPLRGPLHGANAVIGVLAGPSAIARAVTAFVMAVSGAIVGVRVAGVDVNPWLLAAAVVAVAVTGALSVLRTRGRMRMAVGWVAFAALVGVVLIGPSFSSMLFDGPEPIARQDLASDDVIVLDGTARVRLTDGTGDDALVEDIELDEGGTIELRELSTGDSVVTRGESDSPSRWKRWGVVQPWSAFTVIALVVAAWLLLRRERVRRGDRGRALWPIYVATALVAAVVTNWIWRWWRWLVTGDESDSAFKRGFLDVSTWLHDQRIGFLIVGFVSASLLSGTVWRRAWTGRARRPRAAGRREPARAAAGGRGRPSSG